MKVYSNQAESYIKNLKPGSSGAALIYGPDLGAIKAYQRQLVKQLIPGSDNLAIKELTGDEIKEDPASLLDEVSAMNFFAEKRVVIVTDFISSINDIVMEAVSTMPGDVYIIITAEDLGKEAKIKKFFEDHGQFPAIICYKEDERAIRAGVVEKFRASGVKMDRDTVDYLTENLGEDKQITLNEMEKIFTYLGDQKELSFDEAVDLLADSSALTLTDIAFALSTRNPDLLEKSLARAFADKIYAVAILRAVQYHFQRLAYVKSNLRSGMNFDDALKSLRPPVFWKQTDQFKLSLRKWEEGQIHKVLAAITEAELRAKSQSDMDDEMNCRSSLLGMVA